MSVVTIRGQLGSGAPEIGKLIALKLHFEYVDREIIADVAERLKRPLAEVESKEAPPATLFGRITEALAQGYAVSGAASAMSSGAYLPAWEIQLDDTRYLGELEAVIRGLASGDSIVIRGRGSQFILKDYPGAFHILVVAPLKLRLNRLMEDQNLDEHSATKEIERFDRSRREFTKRYFDAEIEDPVNYDLVVNTLHLSFERAASSIIGTLGLKERAVPGG
jgi:cytidylate kinase